MSDKKKEPPSSSEQQREINPMQLSLEQLNSIKTQNEEELQELQRQLEALSGAKSRFLSAKSTLVDIATSANDTPLYIPLNSSLYVPGHIVNNDKVIVELGTGYFCEKSIPDAKDLIDRKIQLVSKSIETVESVGKNKKKNLEQLVQVMQYKISQASEARGSKKAE